MKKILICIPNLQKANGIASFFMNYLSSLNNEVKLDFFLIEDNYSKDIYRIISKQGKIFIAHKHNKFNKVFVVSKNIKNIVKREKYDFVHLNLVNMYAFACVWGLSKINYKSIIYHAHNPLQRGNISLIAEWINKYIINKSKYLIACSSETGKSVFGNKKYDLIHNAINVDKYVYNEQFRKYFKEKYNIKDEWIIGNIGRIDEQKNPLFVLEILKELSKESLNYKFFFVGNGSLENRVKKRVKEYGLENRVFMLGSQENAVNFYSAFDLFLLPSKYEGLGIVFIEAQVSNLPIVTSKNVPDDVSITDQIIKLDEDDDIKKWAYEIIKKLEEKVPRTNNISKIEKAGYSQKNNSELLAFYNKIKNQ